MDFISTREAANEGVVMDFDDGVGEDVAVIEIDDGVEHASGGGEEDRGGDVGGVEGGLGLRGHGLG